MTKRDRWVAELTASRHVHRFLTRIGGASSPAVAPALSDDKVKAYVESLRNGLDDARTLLEALELLSNGYRAFVEGTVPKLLTILSNRTEHTQEIVGPGLRGVVRWDLTKVQRANRTLPSTRYVANVPKRTYDTPENLLLRWLLNDLERGVRRIGKRIGTANLHPALRAVRDGCRAALRNEMLSGVDDVRTVPPAMMQVARQSRHPGYRDAARLAERRLRMQEQGSVAQWSLVLELLKSNWLEPVSDNDLFEIFALSTTLSVLAGEVGLGEPRRYGLLGSALEPAATFEHAGAVVEVYFNRTPKKLFGTAGRYLGITAAFEDIGEHDRRPDIVIRVRREVGVRTFLVEVKNAGTIRYVRESIYKVFGYLHDYDELFGAWKGRRVALYLPDGMVRFRGPEELDSGMVIVTEGERDRLALALREGLAF